MTTKQPYNLRRCNESDGGCMRCDNNYYIEFIYMFNVPDINTPIRLCHYCIKELERSIESGLSN